MVSHFQRLKAEIVDNLVLSPEFFGEEARYTPTLPRQERTIACKITAVQQAELTDAGDEEFVERVRVKVARDPLTGIDEPQMGDLLNRSVTMDPDRRPFVYSGQVLERSLSHWVLMFQRNFPLGRGPRG